MQNLQSCTELMLGDVHRDIGENVTRRKRTLDLIKGTFLCADPDFFLQGLGGGKVRGIFRFARGGLVVVVKGV